MTIASAVAATVPKRAFVVRTSHTHPAPASTHTSAAGSAT